MPIVSEATLRQDTFKEVFDIIDANKPVGFVVLSAFPEVKPTFPVMVVNPVIDRTDLVDLCGLQRDHAIEVMIDIFSLASAGKEKIDIARDNIHATFLNNQTILRTGSGIILSDLEDSDTDTLQFGEQKLNFASVLARFRI